MPQRFLTIPSEAAGAWLCCTAEAASLLFQFCPAAAQLEHLDKAVRITDTKRIKRCTRKELLMRRLITGTSLALLVASGMLVLASRSALASGSAQAPDCFSYNSTLCCYGYGGSTGSYNWTPDTDRGWSHDYVRVRGRLHQRRVLP
jgi:hypothetical protein